ncbi:MAG TPA: glycosyltransferase [Methanomassiliicoccales archaeon]|nr:glycosyltransferase [Methanomassiliicoccales archaeon]
MVTSIQLLKRELEGLGHDVFVFAPAPKEEKDREPGVQYFRSVSFRRYQGYRVPLFPSNKSELVDRLRIDVIHNHGLAFMALRSMFAGRTLEKPVVTTWHTNVNEALGYYNFSGLPDEVVLRLMWVYLRSLLRRSEAVIAPTEAIKADLLRYVPSIRRIEVIPTGVDLVRFRPGLDAGAILDRYGLRGKKVILHLGRIAMEKNMDLAFRGFARFVRNDPELRLVVAGEGPAKAHHIRQVQDLGISDKVVFTGFVPDEELPLFYSACDVFTITSKFETQGLVVLEAMACGKPVVGINYRAVAELVQDGVNGYLFDDDEDSWCRGIRRGLAATPELREKARARAEEYSQREEAKRLVRIYEDAIASKREKVGGARSSD